MNTLSRRSILVGTALSTIGLAPRLSFADEAPASVKPNEPPKANNGYKLGPTEQFLYTTVMIRTLTEEGLQGIATGFSFQLFNYEGKSVPVLVTNKHVIEGALSGTIKFTTKNADGSPYLGKTKSFNLDQFSTKWIPHPDPTVDLAVLPYALVTEFQSEFEHLFYVSTDQSIIPTDEQLKEIGTIEDVLVVGYPDGIIDDLNNIPIFRKGITATPASIDFNGKKEFFVDAAIYPGSSGSPVFLLNQSTWTNRAGQVSFGFRAMLLGIVWGVAHHPENGELKVIPAPTQRMVSTTMIPNNLGACIKSSRLLEFEPEFVRRGFNVPTGYNMRAAG